MIRIGKAGRSERGSLFIDFFLALAIFLGASASFVQLSAAKALSLSVAEGQMRSVMLAQAKLSAFQVGATEVGPFAEPGLHELKGWIEANETSDGWRSVGVVVQWEDRQGTENSFRLDTVMP